MVAARVVFARQMVRKTAAVQRLTPRGVMNYYFGRRFRRQFKHLAGVRRPPRGLIAARYAAKSAGA
jgi:hypothetical protein